MQDETQLNINETGIDELNKKLRRVSLLSFLFS